MIQRKKEANYLEQQKAPEWINCLPKENNVTLKRGRVVCWRGEAIAGRRREANARKNSQLMKREKPIAGNRSHSLKRSADG